MDKIIELSNEIDDTKIELYQEYQRKYHELIQEEILFKPEDHFVPENGWLFNSDSVRYKRFPVGENDTYSSFDIDKTGKVVFVMNYITGPVSLSHNGKEKLDAT